MTSLIKANKLYLNIKQLYEISMELVGVWQNYKTKTVLANLISTNLNSYTLSLYNIQNKFLNIII